MVNPILFLLKLDFALKLQNSHPIIIMFSILVFIRNFVSVCGHIKKYDGAVEEPQWCQLLQDHSHSKELP